jgi:hypothetical protein
MTIKTACALFACLVLSVSCKSTLTKHPAKAGMRDNETFFTGEIWVAPGSADLEPGRTVYLDGNQHNRHGETPKSLNQSSLKSIYGVAMTPKASSSASTTYNVRQ